MSKSMNIEDLEIMRIRMMLIYIRDREVIYSLKQVVIREKRGYREETSIHKLC